MHNPQVQDNKPRIVGRSYAGDLLVQIAQHEDHAQRQHHQYHGFMFPQSPRDSSRESAIYSASPTVTQNDSWPNRIRSRVLDSEALFPPMFFPRNSKRGSKPYISPVVTSSAKVSLGFRIFQVASVLIVGICLYALVDNILFLVRSYADDSAFLDESKRLNIHDQLQSWIIHGEEEAADKMTRISSNFEGNNIISSRVSHFPNELGQRPNLQIINHGTVNNDNLTFLLNNSSLCSAVRGKSKKNKNSVTSYGGGRVTSSPGEDIYFMIIVHSAPEHFSERQAIRSTWGSVKTLKNHAIRLVFILGKSQRGPNVALENSIRRENELFGDIVVGNFEDNYRNLTLKHLLGYKWIQNFCSGATFVLKTDDDVFVSIFALYNYVSRNYDNPQPGTLICNVFPEGTKPVREKNARGSKWSVTMEEYPHSVYPRYCGGLAYLATPDVITRILDVSDHVKFFWIDDVFVTGVLREIAEIEPFYLNLRYSYDPEEYRQWILPAGTSLSSSDTGFGEDDKKKSQRLRKFPFLFVHIQRGDKFGEEMNDLWRKTLREINNNEN